MVGFRARIRVRDVFWFMAPVRCRIGLVLVLGSSSGLLPPRRRIVAHSDI